MGGGLTLFPEKIVESIKGVYDFYYYDYLDGEEPLGMKSEDEWPSIETINPKKHTIRLDNGNRWKEGNLIHAVINNRTPSRYQFAPIIKCTSVQIIEIKDLSQSSKIPCSYVAKVVVRGETYIKPFDVFIDGFHLSYNELEKLAINDGFDSVEQFFQWFNEDFTGKIIHWTDEKY